MNGDKILTSSFLVFSSYFMKYEIKCVNCGAIFTEQETITRCLKCGQALDIQFDIPRLKGTVNEYVLKHTPISAMKYLNFYPLNDRSKIISLNEGGTPLVHSEKLSEKYGVKNLYIKNEGANPTGVFKDRGTLVEVSKALELGAKAIVLASTGNMAASVSAYAAKAGIPCYVLVPENTPIGKLSQSLVHGGKVLKIRGTYTDCVKLSEEMAKKYNYLLAGDYAFRSEGQKSIAFEIIEQLNWNVPDVVLAPVGCGTNLYGIAKGFFEWYELGLITKIPRIVGVQPEKCDTLYSQFYNGKNESTKLTSPGSLCSAVNIGAPLDDMKLLKAIRKSGGDFEIIDDNTVLKSQLDMANMASVFTEPSGAIPVACIKKMVENGKIKPDETVVCVATGTGLKDPHSATLLFSNLPSLDSNISEIDDFLGSGISDVQSQKGNQKILFSLAPQTKEVKDIAKKEFNFDASKNPELFESLCREIGIFFERRKEMRYSDFQILLEDTISDFHLEQNPVLEIIDFSATNSFSGKAKSDVVIKFKGEEYQVSGEGSGPVDAVITAIESLIKQKAEFSLQLEDYEVSVPSGGVNATVQVKITFSDGAGNSVRVMGVSPDIVVASIMAYQKGFSRLYRNQ